MKIAIVNELWTAGATRCAKDLEKGLAARHEIRYFPTGASQDVASLQQALKKFAPALVHLHSYYGSFPYSLLRDVSHQYPTFFTPHDPRPLGDIQTPCWNCTKNQTCQDCPLVSRLRRKLFFLNPYYQTRSHKRAVNRSLHPNTTLISVSRWLQGRLAASELGKYSIEHIPNGIDTNSFQRVPNAREALNLPQGKKLLLYVAQAASDSLIFNERKGLLYLAEAFLKRLVHEDPDIFLLVAGEPWAPNHPRVISLGKLPHGMLPQYYSASDLVICPSLGDNLPFTILEAMACGTPVVASRVGGIPEMIESGVSGVLVEPANSNALSEAIISLLRDTLMLRRMGIASRAKVERDFGMDAFLRNHESLYARRATLERGAA
jgi:glycosyltransferase involved in cell wall biosynthesis